MIDQVLYYKVLDAMAEADPVDEVDVVYVITHDHVLMFVKYVSEELNCPYCRQKVVSQDD